MLDIISFLLQMSLKFHGNSSENQKKSVIRSLHRQEHICFRNSLYEASLNGIPNVDESTTFQKSKELWSL